VRWNCHHSYSVSFLGNLLVKEFWKSINISRSYDQQEMWANAQRDGRPAEYMWRTLFNAAKFG